MTWIVGIAPSFGFAYLASDICVTFRNPRNTHYENCLQKIHEVFPGIVMGFAGSVKIGFRMLHELNRGLSNAPEECGWSMEIVVRTWLPRYLRRIYKISETEEKEAGSQIIIAAGHPNKNLGDADWPLTSVYSMSAPDFEPVESTGFKAIAIGSGGAIPYYQDAIGQAFGTFDSLKLAMLGPTGHAEAVAYFLRDIVRSSPQKGISELFQYAIVTRKKADIFDCNTIEKYQSGKTVKTRLPRLAKRYSDFLAFCKNKKFLHPWLHVDFLHFLIPLTFFRELCRVIKTSN